MTITTFSDCLVITKFSDCFEQFMPAIEKDGQQIGWLVQTFTMHGEGGDTFKAVVQKSIMGRDGKYKPFGAWQPCKGFKTPELARQWAYSTAKERIAKLQRKPL